MLSRNHVISSISAEKTFDKVQHLSMIKSNKETQNRRKRTQAIKAVGNKPILYYAYTFSQYRGKCKALPQKSRISLGYLHSLLFNVVLEVLARRVIQEKEIEILNSKEVKLFYLQNMILYPGDPNGSIGKLINTFFKVTRYKINL